MQGAGLRFHSATTVGPGLPGLQERFETWLLEQENAI